ncbi:hypothetical protein BT63DRAFT_460068 [Microthyrium microscopicum]|uniref:F-box domain-containing protein n=1 Tax=Microthyrium microscopicum TaxID=703497 RepID=A0A6A6TZH7_9PEZI|nr:hypothetical protein BT63DRAFT_460068 [Microthyrium microscopicum]
MQQDPVEPGLPISMKDFILRLPTELLFIILQFSQPSGFQSLILTCKRMYSVGIPLIESHNFCKNWVLPGSGLWCTRLISQPPAPGFSHRAPSMPFPFFRPLLQAPAKYQLLLLRYLTHARWDCTQTKDFRWALWKDSSQSPELHQSLLRKNSEISHLDITHDTIGIGSDLKRCHCLCEADNVQEYGKEICCEFCQAAFLLLLPNLKTLDFVLCNYGFASCPEPPILSAIIHATRGRFYFQELERLCVYGYKSSIMNLTSFLLLPRLETLYVHHMYDSFLYTESERHLDRFCDKPILRLRKLAFFDCYTQIRSLELFLGQIEGLHTFVWEDCTSIRALRSSSQGEANEDLPESGNEAEHETLTEDCVKLLPMNKPIKTTTQPSHGTAVFEDIESEDETQVNNEPVDGEEHLYWNPRRVLGSLLRFKNTLQYLVLTTSFDDDTYGHAPIYGNYQITHFRHFATLKYLKVDTRVLRMRKISTPGNSTETELPYPLTQILPPSIERVEIRSELPEEDILLALLHELPTNSDALPNLKDIRLSFRDYCVDDEVYYEPSPERKALLAKLAEVQKKICIGILDGPLYSACCDDETYSNP